jgi:hypothetical protein
MDFFYFRRDDDAYICVFEPASRPSGRASGKCFILFELISFGSLIYGAASRRCSISRQSNPRPFLP